MASEQLRTIAVGQGASGDTEVTSTSDKIWYPFTPDIIEGVPTSEAWGFSYMVGGTAYYTCAKDGIHGTFLDASVEGCFYKGQNNSHHKDHKFSIFAGGTGAPISRDTVSGKGEGSYVNADVQFPGSLLIKCKGWASGVHSSSNWQAYADKSRYDDDAGQSSPFPVYGVSLDYTPLWRAYTINQNGGIFEHYAAKRKYAVDCQIGAFHAVYWVSGGNDYTARKLLPNGDNWGDSNGSANNSNIDEGKYIFRDNADLHLTGLGLFGDNSQENKIVSENEWEPSPPYKLRLMMPRGETPPANSYFVGITMSMVYGDKAGASKSRQYMISNLGIIDKRSAEIYRDDTRYYGWNAKEIDNVRLVLPKLNSFALTPVPSSPRLYGPMQSW